METVQYKTLITHGAWKAVLKYLSHLQVGHDVQFDLYFEEYIHDLYFEEYIHPMAWSTYGCKCGRDSLSSTFHIHNR